MSAMTFTEDNCGTYPPSYPQRESLRLQRYNKNCTYARILAIYCKINRLSEANCINAVKLLVEEGL